MDIKVTSLVEHEDGSATLAFDLDSETKEFLLQYALKSLLIDYANEAMTTKVKDFVNG